MNGNGPNPLLVEIEGWVLTSPDERLLSPPSQRSKRDLESTPDERLDDVLYRLQFCDHLRTMQIMYRDSEDEQRLAPELRDADAQGAPLPTKALMEKLLEGRCRVVALCRMCRGDESVEGLRALVDLAGAYALQGMWPQVRCGLESYLYDTPPALPAISRRPPSPNPGPPGCRCMNTSPSRRSNSCTFPHQRSFRWVRLTRRGAPPWPHTQAHTPLRPGDNGPTQPRAYRGRPGRLLLPRAADTRAGESRSGACFRPPG